MLNPVIILFQYEKIYCLRIGIGPDGRLRRK